MRSVHVLATLLSFSGTALLSTSASSASVLTVDLSATIGPATHVASGSLYGMTERLPADLNALLMPLSPKMFTNPAANVQQPVGDAIVVAGRLAPIGARVTIRLADWFPRWPYAFSNMNDWLDKVGQTVSRKKASGLDNVYGYEIWNEPNGTWTNSMPFNDFWKQTYARLRELDPAAKIIGPSIAWYDANYLRNFLTFAKNNGCVPDIVAWHELSGGNFTANFQNYRSLEKQLGIGPLPISINEYSGKDTINDEGQPGASAPLIAKFERFQVDTACITYWDVPRPGRLGSLLATNTERNGGWWFYKWYGEMTGNMVSTTPPSPNDAAALDGFANLDASGAKASVIVGGVNDGTIQVVVKGFRAAPFFGTKVRAVVEHTPFVNRSTVVNSTNTLSTAEFTVLNDEITVSISNANGNDGYRLSLSPVGSPGTGGTSGSGGAAGSGGFTGNGGANGSSGTSGSGGASGSDGASGSSGVGGAGASAGSGGGASSSGAVGSGGSLGSGVGGAAAARNGVTGGSRGNSAAEEDGCTCAAPGETTHGAAWATLALAGFGLSLRLRRSSRSARTSRRRSF